MWLIIKKSKGMINVIFRAVFTSERSERDQAGTAMQESYKAIVMFSFSH